jgi:hypothetical protein
MFLKKKIYIINVKRLRVIKCTSKKKIIKKFHVNAPNKPTLAHLSKSKKPNEHHKGKVQSF